MEEGKETWHIPPQACIEIMNSLLEFPCSKIFMEETYCDVKKETFPPQNLSFLIIRDKLHKEQYKSTTEWLSEIRILFWSLIDQNKKSMIMSHICHEFFMRFTKRLRIAIEKHKCKTGSGWILQVLKLKAKLDVLLQNSPECTQPHLPYPAPLEVTTKWLNQEQTSFIKKMLPKVNNPVDLLRLRRIIESDSLFDLVENEELKLDMKKMPQITACKVFDALREIFPEEKVDMPSIETGMTCRPPKI